MAAMRSFCKLLQFESYLGTTCINPCKKVVKVLVLKSKKVRYHKIYLELRLEAEPESEPKEIISARNNTKRFILNGLVDVCKVLIRQICVSRVIRDILKKEIQVPANSPC
jgi:hypothetical protein